MRKKIIKWIIQVIGTVLLLYLAISKINLDALFESLRGVNFYYLALIPLFVLVDLLINSYRIVSLYRFYGVETKLPKVMIIKLQGSFFSLLFPLIGDAYKIQTLKNVYGSSLAKNSLVVLLDRLLFTLALTLILVPVWLLNIFELPLILKVTIIALLIFEFLVLYLLNSPKSFSYISSKLGKLHSKLAFKDFTFSKRKGYASEMFVNTAISVVRHVLTASMYLIIACSLLSISHVNVWLFILSVFSIILSRVIPVSVAGIGLREYIAVMIFPQIGIPPEAAFSIALIVSFVGIAQGLFGGITYLINRFSLFKKL
ncbi:MAG: lysylphosphatidylglycerol synthase transmembrane domain-containing protein [Bacteroidales bacterium]|nr:lysylphosphatidylglycerol synthase transmembrane domain-containing protein [Bacteroidales bacterium]MDD3892615.1 lysylphosphatidylglycerol synthase transmembrane domain-containing protein [Bacteroidales bacterium]